MTLSITLEHTRAAFGQMMGIVEEGKYISYNHTRDEDDDFVPSIDILKESVAEEFIFHLAVASLNPGLDYTQDYEYPESVDPKKLFANIQEIRQYVTYLPDTFAVPVWHVDLTFGGQQT